MSLDAAWALCRFVRAVSLMLLWGAFAYLWVLVPAALGQEIARRLRGLRAAATIAAAVAIGAALPISAARIGDGWADIADVGIIQAVLFHTNVGTVWIAQATGAATLLVTLAMPPTLAWKGAAATSGLLLAMLALDGHAAMHEGPIGVVHRIDDIVHLLAAGAWFGALVALVPVMSLMSDPVWRPDASLALRRFSTAGHGVVALVLATGTINTLLVLGRWPTDWSSPYQALLAAKIAVVLLMTVLAIVNRYGIVPQLGRRPSGLVRALRIGTLAEVTLGIVAIGCVSVFGLLEPN